MIIPDYTLRIPSYTVSWNAPAATTKMVRRAFELSGIPVARIMKWGGRYDICYPGKIMVDSGHTRINDLTYKQWVELAIKLMPSTDEK